MGVIRVGKDVYEELKRLKVKIGARSMSELISILIRIAKNEIDRFDGDPTIFLKTLKYAGEAGEDDSEKIDELLYGVDN